MPAAATLRYPALQNALKFPHTPVWGKIVPACEGYTRPAENRGCQAVPGEIAVSRETERRYAILASR